MSKGVESKLCPVCGGPGIVTSSLSGDDYHTCPHCNGSAKATDENPDPVNHPPHYNSHPARCECGRGIECIQVTEHMGFCTGNVVKYLWRADHKGDAVEELEKARWYLDREIKRRKEHK